MSVLIVSSPSPDCILNTVVIPSVKLPPDFYLVFDSLAFEDSNLNILFTAFGANRIADIKEMFCTKLVNQRA